MSAPRALLHLARFDPLPKTFFERSLFVRPKDRDVVCHASAWDIDSRTTSASDGASSRRRRIHTIHHELGHTLSARYSTQPVLFRDSDDGFSRAIGTPSRCR